MDPSLTGLGDIVIGSLLASLGLAAIALSLFRRQGADTLLLSFGAFVSLYGVRLIFSNPLTPALGASPTTAVWISSVVTYTILIPAWYFFWRALGDGWHRLNYWWVRVVTIFAVVALAIEFGLGAPGRMEVFNNLIVLMGLVVIVTGLLNRRGSMTTDLLIISTGLSVFGLTAINENLVPLGLLPWSWRFETWGFLFFIACLGWVAARRFVATERELANLEGELDAAKRIQASILPERPPPLESLTVATRLRTSTAVSGDFFDFLTPGPRQLGVLVADVSGHGIPAALIASMVKVALASCAELAARPAELLARINQILCGSFQHGFVSAAYVFLELDAATALIASGGHPFPLHRRQADGRVAEVGGGGTILGRFSPATFEERRIRLETGDRLLLYTDGITEASGPGGEMFGDERLRSVLAESGALSAERLCDKLLAALDRWTGSTADGSYDDDLTLLVLDIGADDASAG